MNILDIESVGIQYYRRSQGYKSHAEALDEGAVYGGDIHYGYTTTMDVLLSACAVADCIDSGSHKDDVVACLHIEGKRGPRIVEMLLESASAAIDQYLVDCELPAIHPDNKLAIMLRQANMDPDQEDCKTTEDLCWFPVKHAEIYTDRIQFLQSGCSGNEGFGQITQYKDDWVLGDITYEFCFVDPIAQWKNREQFRVVVPESSKLFI